MESNACEGTSSTCRCWLSIEAVQPGHLGWYAVPALTRADHAEDFQTELEAFASHLVLENQTLQHENKQLNGLLKEYEQTLETVMGKFRGVAVSPILAYCRVHGMH